ncbi:MAG TPA: serine hydrolase domain-containing protein [Streptosporangiaceae bacterium]
MTGLESAQDARSLVDTAIHNGTVPGAVLAAGVGAGEPLLLHVAGRAQDDGAARRAMTADTVFDLASLTKVVATLPCVLHLVARGEAGLDDPVRRYLPGFSGPGKELVTVRQLLAHTSGLPSDRPYHRSLRGRPVVAAALAEPLAARPGTAVCYSDLGFIALGELAAAVAGCGLGQLTQELVVAPLGMAARYLPPPRWLPRIAATEPAGGTAKVGVVHDENAEAIGGVAGHAGLFGTAADLARYAAAWLPGTPAGPAQASVPRVTRAEPPGASAHPAGASARAAGAPFLPAWLRADALRCQTEGLDGRRGLGWVLRGDRWDNMGEGWPAAGAGHTGFTGTSLSIDPVTGLWAVLLTNAVHYGRGPEHSVVSLRKQVHAAVATELLG